MLKIMSVSMLMRHNGCTSAFNTLLIEIPRVAAIDQHGCQRRHGCHGRLDAKQNGHSHVVIHCLRILGF